MINLVAALLLGVALAIPGEVWQAHVGPSRPVYYHLLMMGWATQMIFAVAWWMFPRRSPDQPQTNALSWVVFVALNAGLAVRAVAEPLVVLQPSATSSLALQAAAVLQALAVLAFAANILPRVFAR